MTRPSSSSHVRRQPPQPADATSTPPMSQRTMPNELTCWAKRSELRFDELPRDVQDALSEVIQHRSYQPGDVIFRTGEVPCGLYRIDAGIVKIIRQMPDGPERLILDVRDRGEPLAEETLFDDSSHTTSAQALTSVDLSFVPREALWANVSECPEFLEQLLAVYADRIQRTQEALAMFYFADVETRLAAVVLGLAKRFGQVEGGAMRLSLRLHRWDWAQLVGARVETVSRILQRWAQEGWIRSPMGTLVLSDSAPLEAIVRTMR